MKNILAYFRKQKKSCIAFTLLAIITMVLGIVEPKLTAEMVTAITAVDLEKMAVFAIWIAVVAISSAIIKFFFRNVSVSIRTKVGKELETDLCHQALRMKSCFISDFKSGELTEITKSDSKKFLENFQNLAMMLSAIITSVAVAIYIIFLSWQCAILFFIFALTIFGIQKFSLQKEKKNSENEKENNDTAKSLINQIYKGIIEIKVLNLKSSIFGRYEQLLFDECLSNRQKEKAKSSNRLFNNISFEIYVLGFMLLGFWLMKNNYMNIETFITIFMFKNYLYNLIFQVSEARSNIAEMKILSNRMNKLLNVEKYKLENFGQNNGSISDNHTIELEKLSFSYDNTKDVLKNISFSISEGEFIGIVGESGSAKTTLIKLLSRQLEPSSGNLRIDGLDISEYSESGFSSIVSLASQEPFIFSFSIRENLLMVKPNATESQMWKALEDAQILHFVKSLPDGIDTILKETLNISGGQKQRLSLARIFLKDTPIMLLDEATSALDNKTQAVITKLLQKKVSEGKIIIAIAHRIEAIQDADKILFLKNGCIEAVGTHTELLLLNKSYSDLVKRAV